MIHIVVADELWPGSGNAVTARRMAAEMRGSGLPAEPVRLSELVAKTDWSGVRLLHGLHARRTGPHVRRLAQVHGIPYAITLTGTDLSSDLADPVTRLELEPVLADAAAIVVFDRAEGTELRRLLPDLTSPLYAIRPGAVPPPGASWRRRLRLEPEAVLFFLPAGMRAVKRPLLALEIVEALRRTVPAARLVMAGAEMDAALVARLVEAAKSRPWLSWLGPVPYDQVGGLYRAADVVLNTSLAEGLANSLLEAMALGKPILASDIMGNRAALGQGQGEEAVGLLFNDLEEAVAKARQLALNQPLRRALGEAAARRARQFYDALEEARGYRQLYGQALDEAGADREDLAQ